jgi:UDP-N-acetylmuramoyl-tripeptide--D-alanyl-D-alanine ligase
MKPAGTAVLNADDSRVLGMRDLVKGKSLTYAIENEADVRASEISFERFGETTFLLTTPVGAERVRFPLNGRHNILNALAAAAVGHNFGMSAEAIANSLGNVQPPPQRGEVLHFTDGFTVINDSYNSNPAALLSMVQTLVEGSDASSRKIVVAGEMLELGEDAMTIHTDTGAAIARIDIDLLIGVRGNAAQMVSGALTAGIAAAKFAEGSDAAGEMLVQEIRSGDVVLIKGSRGVRTEKVVEKLLEKFELEERKSTDQ